MKLNENKPQKSIPFDPVSFISTVPSRIPTAKDLIDAEEKKNDIIEPSEYQTMEEAVNDL